MGGYGSRALKGDVKLAEGCEWRRHGPFCLVMLDRIGAGGMETDWPLLSRTLFLGLHRPTASAPLFKDGALGHEPFPRNP